MAETASVIIMGYIGFVFFTYLLTLYSLNN